MGFNLDAYPVTPPKVVAIATQPGLVPQYKFADKDLPGPPLQFGEDFTFGTGGVAPNKEDVGSTETELKPKMRHLLDYFADDDTSGMSGSLFSKFLSKQTQVILFTDPNLDKAADGHENIEYFCKAALGAPYPWGIAPAPGKTRIHQALQAAQWDISKMSPPKDLGAPAFNVGSKYTKLGWGDATGDWANGLGVMIDAIQYVYVVATHYYYSKDANTYFIRLKFMGYDVFGLDNADVDKYGAKKDNSYTKFGEMGVGITAWWQLQHQFSYAPLITRFVVNREYVIPGI